MQRFKQRKQDHSNEPLLPIKVKLILVERLESKRCDVSRGEPRISELQKFAHVHAVVHVTRAPARSSLEVRLPGSIFTKMLAARASRGAIRAFHSASALLKEAPKAAAASEGACAQDEELLGVARRPRVVEVVPSWAQPASKPQSQSPLPLLCL